MRSFPQTALPPQSRSFPCLKTQIWSIPKEITPVPASVVAIQGTENFSVQIVSSEELHKSVMFMVKFVKKSMLGSRL